MHKANKNISFSFGKYGTIILFTIFGLAVIILSDFPFKKPPTWWTYCGKSVCNSIGCTIISATLISLLLEISSIQEMIQNSIKHLLIGKVPFNKYTNTELEKLKEDIFRQQTHMDSSENINDTVFHFEKNLVDIKNTFYYEYHKSDTVLTPISSKKLFKKRVNIAYKLINQTNKPYAGKFMWKIFSPKPDLTLKEIKEQYKILELSVGGETYSEKTMPPIEVERVSKNQYNLYDYYISIHLPEFSCSEYSVECILEYFIPYNDVTQVYNIRYACKVFKHSIHMESDESKQDEWEISGNAFTAFYLNINSASANDDYIVEQLTGRAINISFSNWVLPGSGYVILAQKVM